MAAATMELSIPPERKHPTGTSATSWRLTALVTRSRVYNTASASTIGVQASACISALAVSTFDAVENADPLGSKYRFICTESRLMDIHVPGGSFHAPL